MPDISFPQDFDLSSIQITLDSIDQSGFDFSTFTAPNDAETTGGGGPLDPGVVASGPTDPQAPAPAPTDPAPTDLVAATQDSTAPAAAPNSVDIIAQEGGDTTGHEDMVHLSTFDGWMV